MSSAADRIEVVDPSGVVQFTTDDRQLAMAKAAKLAAPSLVQGTDHWWEKGWRIRDASSQTRSGE